MIKLIAISLATLLSADIVIYKSDIPIKSTANIRLGESTAFRFKYGPYQCSIPVVLRKKEGAEGMGMFSPGKMKCKDGDVVYETSGAYQGYIANRFRETEIYLEGSDYIKKGTLYYVIISADMILKIPGQNQSTQAPHYKPKPMR